MAALLKWSLTRAFTTGHTICPCSQFSSQKRTQRFLQQKALWTRLRGASHYGHQRFFFWRQSYFCSKWERFPPNILQSEFGRPYSCCQKKNADGHRVERTLDNGRSPLKYTNCRLYISLERKVCLLDESLDFHKYCGQLFFYWTNFWHQNSQKVFPCRRFGGPCLLAVGF
jgi:hypothetical protein